ATAGCGKRWVAATETPGPPYETASDGRSPAVAHLEGDVPEGDPVTEAFGQAVDGERRGCSHVVEHHAGALRCRHGQHPLSLPACYQPGLSASCKGRAASATRPRGLTEPADVIFYLSTNYLNISRGGRMGDRGAKVALFDGFARVGGALASGRRIELLAVLANGERPVEALAGEVGLSVANTSQHLQVLRRAGLVATRREGTSVHYRLASPEVFELVRARRATC